MGNVPCCKGGVESSQEAPQSARGVTGEPKVLRNKVRFARDFDQSLLSRKPWTVKHNCLFGSQTLVAYSNCGSKVIGQKGWAPGWLTCSPPAHVVLDLGRPALITKVTIRSTNILASPRSMELLTSTSSNGPWNPAFSLKRAQCNRLGLQVPGNTDSNDNESSSDESFYILGHCTNDADPNWSHAASGMVNEVDSQMMANRGLVVVGCGESHVARWWMLKILDSNGSHYVGINHFTFFGNLDPLPAPEDVCAAVFRNNERDVFKITWNANTEKPIKSFTVVAFPCGIGRGSGGIEMSCPGKQRFLIFDKLQEQVSYVFIVFAIDEGGQAGAWSRVTEPQTISSKGWMLLHFSEWEESESETVLVDEQVEASVAQGHPIDVLQCWSMENPQISESAEKLMEKELLKQKTRTYIGELSKIDILDFAMKYESSIKKLNQGYFTEVENINVATTVTMFLSSTFDDTTAERNYLMEHAYPLLKSFCQSLGLTFSVVDLRWGVRSEATDDHMTIDVCLGELERCLRTSTAASFVFLSGERYGWRALPNRVLATEFDQVLRFVPRGEARDTILHWYLKDENQVPPAYVLQNISGMKEKQIKNNDFWGNAQDVIQTAVRNALMSAADISDDVKANWLVSVTEREVLRGLFEQGKNVEVSAFVIMRTIIGLEDAARSEDAKSKVYYTVQDSDRGLLHDLRKRVKDSIPKSQIREMTVPWSRSGICFENPEHCEYIRELAAGFVAQTQKQIKIGLKKRRLLSQLEREVVHHHSFALRRAQTFIGRTDVRTSINALVTTEGPVVRCVYGPSGTGKTSAMSIAALDARSRWPEKGVIAFRACGTSAMSSNALELMRSLSSQLAGIFGQETQHCDDFDLQVSEFHRVLGLSTSECPALVVIDSLDQLSDLNSGRSDPWRWLPADPAAMPHTKVLVSTLPNEEYGALPALRAKIEKRFLFEIRGVDSREAFNVLEGWLERSGRKLQPSQAAVVRDQMHTAGKVTMLHLRLLHDRVVKWKSYQAPGAVSPTVPGMINLVFDDLERMHGHKLVAELMGLLSASRCGLSEANILDLVSGNDSVLGYKGRAGSVLEFHDPPSRRLPPLVFSRLRRDLGDYMVERGENGTPVLNLYHRQFWETASARYFAPEAQTRLYGAIADYFSGLMASKYPERHIDLHPLRFEPAEDADSDDFNGTEGRGPPNRQKIRELSRALQRAGRWSELVRLLCDLRYLEAVFDSGRSYAEDLLLDYNDSLVRLSDSCEGEIDGATDVPGAEARLTAFYRFVRKWFHVLCLQPDLLPGLAANAPSAGEVSKAAQALHDQRPWIEWRNAPEEPDACVQTQICPAPVACCCFSPSGGSFAVGAGALCLVYDTLSSREIARFSGHAGRVQGLCFSPNGAEVLSVAREPVAHVWSVSTREVVRSLGPHLAWVGSCAWSVAHDMAMTGCANSLVHLWDPRDGILLAILEGHTGPVASCAFLGGGGLRALTGSEDGSAVVWDLEQREPVTRLAAGSPVNCVDTSSDGRLLAVAASAGSCALWVSDAGRFSLRHRLGGHVSEVWACRFSPDAEELITGAADRVGRVFCTRTGAMLGKVQGHLQWVLSVSWAGRLLLTGSCDGSVKLWERAHVRPAAAAGRSGPPAERPLAGLRFADGGTRLRALTTDLSALVLDLDPVRVLEEQPLQPGGPVQQAERKADLSTDGSTWAFPSYDSSFCVLRPAGGTVSAEAVGVPFDVANTTVRWHPSDPDRVLTGGDGGAHIVVTSLAQRRAPLRHWEGTGWVMDLAWAPNGSGVAAACQRGTLWLDVATSGARVVAPPSLSVCVDGASRRVAAVTMAGGGYEVIPTGGVITDLASGGSVRLADPILEHAKLRDRNCRWAAGDRLVLVATAGTSALGCPALSAFRAADGACVARFCSPYPSNFSCLDVAPAGGGSDGSAPAVVLADEAGRIFVLAIRGLQPG